jgi:putative transposase
MPSGLKRFQKAESLPFITFSCFHRLPLLEASGARETVEAVLEQVRTRHQARIYACVPMPEHVHLLVIEPPQILLAQFLKVVKQMTSRKLRGPRDKFWQDRYYDSNVRGEKARSEVIRSIQRDPVNHPSDEDLSPGTPVNHPSDEDLSPGTPVKRGLVAKPENWPWSSFRHYASCVKGTVEIESQWTAFRRGGQLPVGDRLRGGKRSCFPTQAAKNAAWMGHNASRENQKRKP